MFWRPNIHFHNEILLIYRSYVNYQNCERFTKKEGRSLPARENEFQHYSDVIMGTMASQTTSLTNIYSVVYSGADQRKHQSSASLAFMRGIHRWPLNSPHKGPVTREMFPFDDVIMIVLLLVLDTKYGRPRVLNQTVMAIKTSLYSPGKRFLGNLEHRICDKCSVDETIYSQKLPNLVEMQIWSI